MMNERVPEPEVWAAHLRDFVDRCVVSSSMEEDDRVREAVRLLGSPAGPGEVDSAAVEAMLECGAAESAVLAMLGSDAVFMVSRGQGSSSLATVIVCDGSDEVMSEGATLALALLAAYGGGLLAGLKNRAVPRMALSRPASRLH